MKLPVSCFLITRNEADRVSRSIRAVHDLVDEIIVVDSGSTDRTVAIAESAGAKILHHDFTTHARQWRWALDHTTPRYDWILGLDADQRVTPELRAEIAAWFNSQSQMRRAKYKIDRCHGFYLKRRQIFRGKWIRHGGYYPKYLLKLFHRECVTIDIDELIDHHFYVTGPVAKLHNDIVEENAKENDISFWIAKHNHYATLLAREELRQRQRARPLAIPATPFGSPDQRILWIKQLWSKLPLYVRPLVYFFYRYFVRLGFLDGKQGFIFHFLHGFWFRLVIDIKIDEMLHAALPDRELS